MKMATSPGVVSSRHVPRSSDSSHDARGQFGVSIRIFCSAGLPSVVQPDRHGGDRRQGGGFESATKIAHAHRNSSGKHRSQ